MRLIDADALRDCAFEVYQGNGVELKTIMVVPLAEINNAPTVDLTKTQSYMKLYSRPQGEWVIQRLQNGFDDVYCPFCNARPTRSEYGYYLRDNFCHDCGADMRGKEE